MTFFWLKRVIGELLFTFRLFTSPVYGVPSTGPVPLKVRGKRDIWRKRFITFMLAALSLYALVEKTGCWVVGASFDPRLLRLCIPGCALLLLGPGRPRGDLGLAQATGRPRRARCCCGGYPLKGRDPRFLWIVSFFSFAISAPMVFELFEAEGNTSIWGIRPFQRDPETSV